MTRSLSNEVVLQVSFGGPSGRSDEVSGLLCGCHTRSYENRVFAFMKSRALKWRAPALEDCWIKDLYRCEISLLTTYTVSHL